jgi:hypothetical protein
VSEQSRDRAIAAADAVLHLKSPRSADEAGYVLCEVSRLAADSRSANHEAASTDTGDPLTWLRPSTDLASRLESTVTRWTTNLHPPSVWDQAAAEALDRELGELDRLAVEVASVAEFCARAERHRQAHPPWPADLPEPAPRPRRYAAVWAPALGLTVAVGFAVFGVLAGLPAHTAASAEPAQTFTPAHSVTSTLGHDLVLPLRATTSPAMPVPAKAQVITALPTGHADVTYAAAPGRARGIGHAHSHRPHRPADVSSPAADLAARELGKFGSSIIAAVTQEIEQQLLAVLQHVQQVESSVLSSLQDQGR